MWLTSDPPPAAAVLELNRALLLESSELAPPPASSDWQPTTLPTSRPAAPGEAPHAAWFRMGFDLTTQPVSFWAVLLPYLYGGGQVWLDGEPLGDVPVSTKRVHVRWERPHLLVVPARLLRAGRHELWVHTNPVQGEAVLHFPAPRVGPLAVLQAQHDQRYFWVHTMPELTVGGCLIVAMLVSLIWWQLPEEMLFGWFGLAASMWGIRTLTFVMETVPSDRWQWWRLVYLASTGGFVVVLALFAARLAGLRNRWLECGLLAYWAIGPLWLAVQGLNGDAQVNRLWTAGLIPIGIGTVVVSFMTVWRQRTVASMLLPTALAVAMLAGVHDYLLEWEPAQLERFVPAWTSRHYFLLHYGADLLLVAMGVLLSTRFVRSVKALRELNETLESRIADREIALAANFNRLAELERQNAASQERKLIMREIHDGLGSKLFTSLSRVERGAMDPAQMTSTLRACISEMRLALEALSPDDHDLLTAFGDFMFRWQAELQAASVRCEWSMDIFGDTLEMSPHSTLQVLRVAQEALTNVARHAGASRVELSLSASDVRICLRIIDDGVGIPAATASTGRGLHNMRTRARQLGGTLVVERGQEGGTVVTLDLPWEAVPHAPSAGWALPATLAAPDA